jgi:hypothetical protein
MCRGQRSVASNPTLSIAQPNALVRMKGRGEYPIRRAIS